MRLIGEKIPTWVALIVIGAIALAAHYGLIGAGMAFQDSDDATVPIITTLFRQGHWSPFPMQQLWGGMTLLVLRTGWVVAWEALSRDPWSHVTSQMTFTYGLVPLLLAWLTYELVRTYCSKKAAFWSGCLAAVGFNFWTVELLQRDFYTGFVLLGFLILILRVRLGPIERHSRGTLFGVGVLWGVALYTCRASAIFIVAYMVSWDSLRPMLRDFFRPKKAWAKWLCYPTYGLLGAFAVSWVFGEDWGTLPGGRHFKTVAFANLQLAAPLIAVFLGVRRWKGASRKALLRDLILALGLVVGLSPEIGYLLLHRGGTDYHMVVRSLCDFDELTHVLALVPTRILEVTSAGAGVSRFASVALFGFATAALIRKARKDARLRVITFAGVLSIVAFFLVTQTGVGSLRYLLPLSPILLVAFGTLIDEVSGTKWAWCVLALVASHCWQQLSARADYVDAGLRSGVIEQQREVVQTFQHEKVPLVISDEYWESNQYTFLSRWDPVFISNGRVLGVADAFEGQKMEKRVGVLLTHGVPKSGTIRLNGIDWILSPLKTVGTRHLFIGQKEGSLKL